MFKYLVVHTLIGSALILIVIHVGSIISEKTSTSLEVQLFIHMPLIIIAALATVFGYLYSIDWK